jgi:hypothetical protein
MGMKRQSLPIHGTRELESAALARAEVVREFRVATEIQEGSRDETFDRFSHFCSNYYIDSIGFYRDKKTFGIKIKIEGLVIRTISSPL